MEEANNPFVQGSPSQEIPAVQESTGEQQSETPSEDGGAATELPEVEVPPMLSPLQMLDGMLKELEGAAHMSKIEIQAIIVKYRTLRGE